MQRIINLSSVNVSAISTLGTGDRALFVCKADNGAFEIPLPDAKGNSRPVFVFRKEDYSGNNITITTRNSQTIDGQATFVLSGYGASVVLSSDGDNYVTHTSGAAGYGTTAGYYVHNEDELVAAITAIGDSAATIFVVGNVELSASRTTAQSTTVEMQGSGRFTLNGYTLTSSGDFVSDLQQRFDISGGGSVVLSEAAVIYPQWYGALADVLAAQTVEIQAAIDTAASGDARRTVFFTSGRWYTNTLDMTNKPCSLRGEQDGASSIWLFDTPGNLIDINNTSEKIHYEFEKLQFNSYLSQSIQATMPSGAASGQPDIVVDDSTGFVGGYWVKLQDGSTSEFIQVDSVAGNTITMRTNLANTYGAASEVKNQSPVSGTYGIAAERIGLSIVRDCLFSRFDRGISWDICINSQIVDNTFGSLCNTGVRLNNNVGYEIDIAGNFFDENWGDACVVLGQRVQIVRNRFKENRGTGVILEAGDRVDNLVANNLFVGGNAPFNPNRAIELNGNKCTVIGNVIRDNFGDAPIALSSGTTGNRILNNGFDGDDLVDDSGTDNYYDQVTDGQRLILVEDPTSSRVNTASIFMNSNMSLTQLIAHTTDKSIWNPAFPLLRLGNVETETEGYDKNVWIVTANIPGAVASINGPLIPAGCTLESMNIKLATTYTGTSGCTNIGVGNSVDPDAYALIALTKNTEALIPCNMIPFDSAEQVVYYACDASGNATGTIERVDSDTVGIENRVIYNVQNPIKDYP